MAASHALTVTRHQDDAVSTRRQDGAAHAENPGGGVDRFLQIAGGVDQTDQEKIADRVALELARVKSVFEGGG